MKTYLYSVFTTLFILFNSIASAEGPGDILSDDVVSEADTSVLKSEAQLFDTIRQGVALNLALCAGNTSCLPDVNRGELEFLVEKLNERISRLSGRYQESGDTELEKIILSYAESRDSYNGFIASLDELAPEDEEDIDFEDDFSSADF